MTGCFILFFAFSCNNKEENTTKEVIVDSLIVADTADIVVESVDTSAYVAPTSNFDTNMTKIHGLIKCTEKSKDKVTEIKKITTENRQLKKELDETKKELEIVKKEVAKDTLKKKKGLIKRIVESIKKDTTDEK